MNDTLADMRRERRELEQKIQDLVNDFATKWSLHSLDIGYTHIRTINNVPAYVVTLKVEV